MRSNDSRSNTSPSAGVSSIFQSPVCTIVPCSDLGFVFVGVRFSVSIDEAFFFFERRGKEEKGKKKGAAKTETPPPCFLRLTS